MSDERQSGLSWDCSQALWDSLFPPVRGGESSQYQGKYQGLREPTMEEREMTAKALGILAMSSSSSGFWEVLLPMTRYLIGAVEPRRE